MNDRELLELAAKAAGIDLKFKGTIPYSRTGLGASIWDPLSDDGDALRLAVNLGICIQFIPDCDTVQVYQENEYAESRNVHVEAMDDYGTRRAIVRAAAEIGKAMP